MSTIDTRAPAAFLMQGMSQGAGNALNVASLLQRQQEAARLDQYRQQQLALQQDKMAQAQAAARAQQALNDAKEAGLRQRDMMRLEQIFPSVDPMGQSVPHDPATQGVIDDTLSYPGDVRDSLIKQMEGVHKQQETTDKRNAQITEGQQIIDEMIQGGFTYSEDVEKALKQVVDSDVVQELMRTNYDKLQPPPGPLGGVGLPEDVTQAIEDQDFGKVRDYYLQQGFQGGDLPAWGAVNTLAPPDPGDQPKYNANMDPDLMQIDQTIDDLEVGLKSVDKELDGIRKSKFYDPKSPGVTQLKHRYADLQDQLHAARAAKIDHVRSVSETYGINDLLGLSQERDATGQNQPGMGQQGGFPVAAETPPATPPGPPNAAATPLPDAMQPPAGQATPEATSGVAPGVEIAGGRLVRTTNDDGTPSDHVQFVLDGQAWPIPIPQSEPEAMFYAKQIFGDDKALSRVRLAEALMKAGQQ